MHASHFLYTAQGWFQVWRAHAHRWGCSACWGDPGSRACMEIEWRSVEHCGLSELNTQLSAWGKWWFSFFGGGGRVVCTMQMAPVLINRQLNNTGALHCSNSSMDHWKHICLQCPTTLSLATCLSTAAMFIFSREMRHQSTWSTEKERDSHPLNYKKVLIWAGYEIWFCWELFNFIFF